MAQVVKYNGISSSQGERLDLIVDDAGAGTNPILVYNPNSNGLGPGD